MRYILAICFVCTIGAPGARAMPWIGSDAAFVRNADAVVKLAKHKRQPVRQRQSRTSRSRNLGGIHPLVGSGDY